MYLYLVHYLEGRFLISILNHFEYMAMSILLYLMFRGSFLRCIEIHSALVTLVIYNLMLCTLSRICVRFAQCRGFYSRVRLLCLLLMIHFLLLIAVMTMLRVIYRYLIGNSIEIISILNFFDISM